MIANLDEMKAFLQWCREAGVVAVKFEKGACEIGKDNMLPMDIVFSGSPPDAGTIASGGPIAHSKFKEDGPTKADGAASKEGEDFTDEDLYGSTG